MHADGDSDKGGTDWRDARDCGRDKTNTRGCCLSKTAHRPCDRLSVRGLQLNGQLLFDDSAIAKHELFIRSSLAIEVDVADSAQPITDLQMHVFSGDSLQFDRVLLDSCTFRSNGDLIMTAESESDAPNSGFSAMLRLTNSTESDKCSLLLVSRSSVCSVSGSLNLNLTATGSEACSISMRKPRRLWNRRE